VPAQPAWFCRLDQILAALRELGSTWLDRRAIEKLFEVKPRRAQQLMRRFGPADLIGKNTVIKSADLIGQLQALARGEEIARWRTLRQRAADAIRQAEAAAAARAIPVPAAPDRLRRRLRDLPSSVRLSPGHLEIFFLDINDLWRQLGELAGAAIGDREAFREAATPIPEERPGV
jgi:hypothetical protein